MKFNNIISAIAITALMFSSCSFLDEKVPTKVQFNGEITSEQDAALFLFGGYAMVKKVVFSTDFYNITDLLTDDADSNNSGVAFRNLTTMTYNYSDPSLRAVWGNMYAVINQMNILLDNIERHPDITAQTGNIMAAEAKFIRAWAYYNLVQLWGPVPLVTVPTYSVITDNLKPTNSTYDLIYSQIINDLSYAAANLENEPRLWVYGGGIKYQFVLRKGAAKTLLAKVYMLRKQYLDVVDELEEYFVNDATTSKFAGLASNFQTVALSQNQSQPERKLEVFWEIESRGETGFNNTMHRHAAGTAVVDSEGLALEILAKCYGSFQPTYNLFKSFDQRKDKRYRQGYRFSAASTTSRPYCRKLVDESTANVDLGGVAVVLLRAADTYLTLAEAYNELGAPGKALPMVNKIRQRAGVDLLPEGLTQSQMRDAIRLERRHEFAHEAGNRLYDLRRWGIYKETMQAFIAETSALLTAETTPTAIFIDPRPRMNASGQPVDINTRAIEIPFVKKLKVWNANDRLLLHPIPYLEMYNNKKLVQNPGW